MYSICILVFLIRNLAISTSQNVLDNIEEDKEDILFRERRSVNFYQTGHKLQVTLIEIDALFLLIDPKCDD